MFCKAPAAMWDLLDATYDAILDITYMNGIVAYTEYGQVTPYPCSFSDQVYLPRRALMALTWPNPKDKKEIVHLALFPLKVQSMKYFLARLMCLNW